MKKIFVGTFYILQGVGHFTIFVFPSIVRGINGGGMAGLEIMIRYYFVLASCLSFLTALLLFLGSKHWAYNYLAKYLGVTSSSLFMLFHGLLIVVSYSNVFIEGYYVYHYFILLIVSLLIIVLNVV